MKEIRYKAQPWIDLRDELDDKEVRSFSLGYDGKLYVLTTFKKDNVQYRSESGIYPRPFADTPHDYLIYVANTQEINVYTIPNQIWNYNRLQPMPDDEILLLCTNAYDDEKKEIAKNARVFSVDGTLKREFIVGDDFDDVKTTVNGDIWVGYIDRAMSYPPEAKEGDPEYPIGVAGLNKFNTYGERIYQYNPIDGLDGMFHCYAINVDSDNTLWTYYYYDTFPLVKIVNDEIVDYWQSPVRGSGQIAIRNNLVIFCGTYGDKDKGQSEYFLYKLLANHRLEQIAKFRIVPFTDPYYRYSRGDTIVLYEDDVFYRVTITELLSAINF